MEQKSEWFCGVKIFRSNFSVEWENGVWTKIRFLASGFLFTCGNFTLIFTVFDILHRSFPRMVFLVHWFSVFYFFIWFFRNGFPNSLMVRFRYSFCLVNESSLNCTSGLVPLCFFFNSSSPSMILATIDFFLISVTSTALHFKFVCVSSFFVL